MRRADRLFQIVQILRRGRVETAASLAARLEVSERTVYRDMRDLMASGAPIDGEAGVGYILRKSYDLPPLTFTAEELEALTVAGRMLSAVSGKTLSGAVASALSKIETALPEERRRELSDSRVFVPDFTFDPETGRRLDLLRTALNSRRVVSFAYVRADGAASRRAAWPLGLFFWGVKWTLGAWCELRAELRTFRVDRMDDLTLAERCFDETPGRRVADYLGAAQAEMLREGAGRP